MTDPILKLFNRCPNLDDVIFRKNGSGWKMIIQCHKPQRRETLQSTYRNGQWQSFIIGRRKRSDQNYRRFHPPTRLVDEREPDYYLPDAIDAVLTEISQKGHDVTEDNLYQIHYFRDQPYESEGKKTIVRRTQIWGRTTL